MSKFLLFLFINLVTFSMQSVALSDDIPSIEVKGQASVLAQPDHYSLSIAIIERGRLTSKIRAIVDHKSDQVIQVAKNLGIKDPDINSAKVSLRVIEAKPSIKMEGMALSQNVSNASFANDKHSKVYAGIKPVNKQNNVKPQYFELRRSISINFSRIEDYDQFLSKVIKLGVSHIYPLTMSVENSEKHYQQALELALDNAKEKATRIANHANVTLGKLIFVKEQSSHYYRPRLSAAMMSSEMVANHSSQVGNQVINANVLVKFSLAQ